MNTVAEDSDKLVNKATLQAYDQLEHSFRPPLIRIIKYSRAGVEAQYKLTSGIPVDLGAQLRQHVASNEIALSKVRVPGENERGDSGVANLADFRHDLVGVADDGDARPAARPTDASPQVSFDVTVGISRLAKLALSCDTG